LIYFSNLNLVNFRNYEQLDLAFEPGMVLIEGTNGQGKSNIIEALNLISLGKSLRTSSDNELVRWQNPSIIDTYTTLSATAQQTSSSLKIQIAFKIPPNNATVQEGMKTENYRSANRISQKFYKINGASAQPYQLVGKIPTVTFTSQNLDIILGSPSDRRRYLDILISQFDSNYLRSVQKYHHTVVQRNHLLRAIAENRSTISELDFWDKSLIQHGQYIMIARSKAIESLSSTVNKIYKDLSNNKEILHLSYEPNIDPSDKFNESVCGELFMETLSLNRNRDLIQKHTTTGPHRDEMSVTLQGMSAAKYASRGQIRTAILSLKLAEAIKIEEESDQMPILLLDDFLSELDKKRRAQLFEHISRYHQSFTTTADLESIDQSLLPHMTHLKVRSGEFSRL
tara:strand:+ start:767 stop:1960 length:1194 start_codon:yes stop_codon:yes gene_type:complete